MLYFVPWGEREAEQMRIIMEVEVVANYRKQEDLETQLHPHANNETNKINIENHELPKLAKHFFFCIDVVFYIILQEGEIYLKEEV